jgi:NAD+ synthase (glutamine-hydrolysing)
VAQTPQIRLGLAQIDPTVGDIDGNTRKIEEWIGRAKEAGVELVIFPELCVPGYPAEDLYLKRHFLDANLRAVDRIATAAHGIAVMVGYAEPAEGAAGENEPRAYNSLAVLSDGKVGAVYRKQRLPNYAVFDEKRYFLPAHDPQVIEVAGVPVGLTICEDCWVEGPPASEEAENGAHLLVNPSGSPYHRGKGAEREEMFAQRCAAYGAAFAFCNMVGGQDELVFDGHSLVFDADGELVARGRQFEEELLICDLGSGTGPIAELLTDLDEVYAALTVGLRDYVRKNGFRHVALALSGGIDSALVALIAVDALGPEAVTCVVMPSPHSSSETQADARRIAANLGTELVEVPIESMMSDYAQALDGAIGAGVDGAAPVPGPGDPTRAPGPDLAGSEAQQLTEENLQARIRGNLMMALSNRYGWLVLTTGNKSEMSVGYATLYGDMAGGFAVIKDVPKTLVYELVRNRNTAADRELVPESVLERAPSAELRPGQLDSDSLPPYEVLDRILEAYVEQDAGREEIVASTGLPADVVDEVIRLVDRSEYKRRQAPPGIRITPRAFGRDRRLPITNRFGG